MILVKATRENCTTKQLAVGTMMMLFNERSGHRTRSSTLQMDETTGFIVITVDFFVRAGGSGEWITIESQIDRDGRVRAHSQSDGWTEWREVA